MTDVTPKLGDKILLDDGTWFKLASRDGNIGFYKTPEREFSIVATDDLFPAGKCWRLPQGVPLKKP